MTAIPDYMSNAIEAMYLNEQKKRSEANQKKADLWKRNPITGKKVVAEKYNNRCNWRGL